MATYISMGQWKGILKLYATSNTFNEKNLKCVSIIV